MTRRRGLRRALDLDAHDQLIQIAPIQAVREGKGVLASLLYVPGTALLVVAFFTQLLDWLGRLMNVTIPMIDTLLPWTPILFAIGTALSVLGIIFDPRGDRVLMTAVLAGGYVLIWMGVI